MSPGQQFIEVIFSTLEALLTGAVTSILQLIVGSFLQPVFEAIAMALGVPAA